MAYRQYYLKSLDSNIPIGKYKNMTVEEVLSIDISFIQWLTNLPNVRTDQSIITKLNQLTWLSN